MKNRMPAVFVGHGGPLLALEDNGITRGMAAAAEDVVARHGGRAPSSRSRPIGIPAAASCRARRSPGRCATCTGSPASSTSSAIP